MQKIALPVIFLAAVGAALYYVSVEEHSAGTLFLLGAVLLVGQVCATLPFIFEARKTHAGTSLSEMQKKTLANQRVIQDDVRALGEAMIRRFNAISERQADLEKKLAAASSAEDLEPDIDELFKKIDHALEERAEALRESVEELLAKHAIALGDALPAKEDFLRHFENTAEQLEETLCAIENFSAPSDGNDDDADESDGNAEGEEEVSGAEEEASETPPSEENEEAGEDENLEDFPESEDDGNAPVDDDAAGTPPPATATDENSPRRTSTLILDAMFGIENKPFLRGNAPGLSTERGVPMNFVEIGIWRFDFEPSAEEFSVTIHLNDAPEPLGEPIVLSPGQTLEIRPTPERP